ncbi:MAG TPA: DUF1648 domain-containing protein [Pirellulaceae bacterium]|nr:DUF1648 domain-containing protein [Pirellulaceae bacterium]
MTRFYFTLAVAATVLTLAASAAVYPWLPAQIPTHWNIQGQIDGHGSKQWAAFLTPAIMAGVLGLFLVLPWLSPKQFSLDTFRDTYWFIALALIVTLAYIHGLTTLAALRGGLDITRAMLAGLLIMFGLLGRVMTSVRRNFWVGVRTPWTIASERVWDDTHRLAARLFVVAAVAGLVVVILPVPLPAVFIVVMALIMGAALWPVVYSLIHYKQLERRGEI